MIDYVYMKQFVLLLMCGLFVGITPVSAEEIDSFDVVVNVGERGELHVTEQFVMDFGEDKRHGLIRVLPLTFSRWDHQYNVRISDIHVRDVPFSTTFEDGLVKIIIGDEEQKVTGEVAYHVTYRIDGAVLYDDAVDILVWDPVGTRWSISMNNVTAVYRFFKPLSRNRLQLDCGLDGGQKCDAAAVKEVDAGLVSEVLFEQRTLLPDQSMFHRMTFSKGFLKTPRPVETFLHSVKERWYMIFFGVVLVVAVDVWRRRRKIRA